MRRAVAARPASFQWPACRWASSTASSSVGGGGDDTNGLYSTDTNSLIGRTLYRQLMRWCKTVGGTDIPMSHLIPPVSLTAPRIDGEALKRLASLPTDERGEYIVGTTSSSDGCNDDGDDLTRIHNMLPKDAIVDDNLLICPVRRAVPDLIGLIRAVYRINSPNFAATAGEGAAASPSDIKERVNLGFEAIRSLNELTEVINHMNQQRKDHRDRSGVDFHVGQVVQHKGDRWRGIVVGWRRGPSAPMQGPGGGSSLTTKDYGTPAEKDASATIVRYDVIIDTGDAHLLGGKRNVDAETGFPLVNQVDLEAVDDPLLVRIRSHWTNSKMDRFDSQDNKFIPNDFVRYEYPADCDETGSNEGSSSSNTMPEETDEIASAAIGAVRDFAGHLHKNILEMTPSPETRGNTVISSIRERLLAISSGTLTDPNDVASLMADNMSVTSLAAMHLQQVLEIGLEVSEMSWQRHIALKDKERIRFPLGTIVHHKKYGFRGVSGNDYMRMLFPLRLTLLIYFTIIRYNM